MSISGRSRDRGMFYSPPAMRSYNQQPELRRKDKQVMPPNEDQSESFVNSNSSRNVVTSNLDRFMKMSTPIVTAQHFPKSIVKGWRNKERYQPYFVLGDLWETYGEWSCYGAGVPLVLNERDYVVQYYTPYLSGIQLYIDPSAPIPTSRRPGEHSDSGSSDGSYEGEGGGDVAETNLDSVIQTFSNKLMLDEHEIRNPREILDFEFYEHQLPYQRDTLANKVSSLAKKCPALTSYRSCDLSPSSWFSVSWYPIYRIPHGPSLQEVETSFVTFHSFRGMEIGGGVGIGDDHLSLPILGFSVYKFRSADWIPDVDGIEKVNSMILSTEKWLQSLRVYHQDFMHFRQRTFLW